MNRTPEPPHPLVTRDHPQVKVMVRVFVVKVVHMIGVKNVSLSFPYSHGKTDEILSLFFGEFVQALEVSFRRDNDKPWYGIGKILMSVKKCCFSNDISNSILLTLYNFTA